MSGLLQAQPLDQGGRFNWVFLIEILVNGILGLFFLFYFNRLFATILSYAIRAYTWHAYRAHIDITALQISLLAGRVFFKGITYHGHNITVYVHNGHITWRYWFMAVRDAAVFAKNPAPERAFDHASPGPSSESNGSQASASPTEKTKFAADKENTSYGPANQAPCRLSIKLSGLEAFIYNQSPKYDAVVDAAKRQPDYDAEHAPRKDTESEVREESDRLRDEKDRTARGNDDSDPRRLDTRSSMTSRTQQAPSDLPRFLQSLPISIECKRAAATIGNENTNNVLTAKVEKSAGVIDASSAGPLDIYKFLLNFELENVQMSLKPNRDFRQLQLDAARRALDKLHTAGGPSVQTGDLSDKPVGFWKLFRLRILRRPRHDGVSLKAPSLKSVRSQKQGSFQEPFEGSPLNQEWQGLNRYMNDGAQDEHDEWRQVEYAKASQLVDVPKVVMCFYWDIPGYVPEPSEDTQSSTSVIGDDSPEYGLKLAVHGGEIVYGPWADRQRIVLQNVFFPASYVNTSSAPSPRPGELRAPTQFKIAITLEDDVTLRIPMREPSKDHKWKGRAEQMNPHEADELHGPFAASSTEDKKRRKQRKSTAGPVASDLRHYAWLDVTVKTNSSIHYQMDMFAGHKGFGNSLRVQIQGVEMQSSVNHGLLWRSGALDLSADLSYPLEWNGLRRWPFQIVCHDLELFILRDHLFLVIDLVNDWASGGPPDFNTFVPFLYLISIEFRDFRMYLNVNDANIINDPAEFDKNDFLTLEGQLQATLAIPMEDYRPQRSEISFDVLAERLQMRMLSSSKSTLATFIAEKQMATLQRLTLNGSFSACQILEAKASDVLRMDLVGSGLKLTAFGCFIRQLINLKENYFGDYMHFKTLEEFQAAAADHGEAKEDVHASSKPRTSNELDVIICIVVEDAIVALPTNLYSAKTAICAELPRAELDLRVNSYYLDIEVDLAPISVLEGSARIVLEDSSEAERSSATQIYISSANVNGHRMLGPPPKEFAYVSHWNVDVGQIRGELLGPFLNDLVSAGKAFAFSMQDRENALPLVAVEAVHDITFAQISVGSIRLWSHAGDDALVLMAQPASVDVSGWSNDVFSQRVTITLPEVTVAAVAAADVSRLDHDNVVLAKTHAFIQTGLAVELVVRKAHVEMQLLDQQNHLRQNDERTHRAVCLQRASLSRNLDRDNIGFVEPAVMPLPDIAPPLNEKASRRAGIMSRSPRAPSGSVSFADSQSSLAGSVPAAAETLTEQIEAQHLPALRNGLSAQALNVETQENDLQPKNKPDFLQREGRAGHAHTARSSVPFSSPYAEPYFPLDAVRPEETNVPPYPPLYSSLADLGISDGPADADIAIVEHECEQMTVMIHVTPGIRAFATPQVAVTISNMLDELSPKTADDVMDAYQIEVMNTIETRLAKALSKGKILEIKLAVPAAHLRFFCNPLEEEYPAALNILLGSFDLALRSRSSPLPEEQEDALVMHTNLDSLRISLHLSTTNSSVAEEPALNILIDDALAWSVLGDLKSVHLSIREHSFVISGSQTAGLVDLALALLPLIEHLIKKFRAILKSNADRVRLLMFFLTDHSDGLGDPQFMTRMVYTLRAHPNHFRNQDSWKILSRFRHILHSLPDPARLKLRERMQTDTVNCPPNAHLFVVQSWSQWRNWDVPHVSQTVAFSSAFNLDSKAEQASSRPMTLTVRSESCRVAVSHGDLSSDVIVGDISLGVETTPPSPPQGLMLLEENKRAKTIVQLHTGSVGIALRWPLLDMAEAVLRRRDSLTGLTNLADREPFSDDADSAADDRPRHDLHLVLSTDSGRIDISSRVLRHVSQAHSLKLSLVSTTRANQELGQCTSAMLNFDSLTTELFGPSKRVLRTSILSPSLYIDHLQPLLRVGNLPTVTVAIAFKELQTIVDEQLPGILHIIEIVIEQDVPRMQSLFSMMPDSGKQNNPGHAIPPVTTNVEQENSSAQDKGGLLLKDLRFHVAVLAGTARVEISLLQSLVYRLESKTTSIRVAPCLQKERTFDIDFDVGGQSHFVVNLSAPKKHVSGILDVPPVNGHVRLELGRQATSILGDATVQKIEVQAGAVQELAGVISQPEVQNVISAVQDGVSRIQERTMQLDQHTTDASHDDKNEPTPIKFDMRIAVLGIRVSARTPGLKAQSTAELEFGVGPVNMTARSTGAQSGKNYTLPEMTAEIRHIGGSLRVKEEGVWQSCGHLSLDIQTRFSEGADHDSSIQRQLDLQSDRFEVNAYPDTGATIMAMFNHLQDKVKHLDLSGELEYLRRMGLGKRQEVLQRLSGNIPNAKEAGQFSPEHLLSIKTHIQFQNIELRWIADAPATMETATASQDLVFSIRTVELATRGGNGAQLTLQEVKLEIAERDSWLERSPNSAVLPEVAFRVTYWSRDRNRSVALKASGRPVDIRLESSFLIPVNRVQRSIERATQQYRTGSRLWQGTSTKTGNPRSLDFDFKRLKSLLVEAEFAGATVHMQGFGSDDRNLSGAATALQQQRQATARSKAFGDGKPAAAPISTSLTAPGMALKLEYDTGREQPALHVEVRVEASSNMLLPNVVPLALEVSNSIKEIVASSDRSNAPSSVADTMSEAVSQPKFLQEESIVTANPAKIFGRTKVDVGFRICRQEFGLSCQPIAKVDARASLEDLYFAINTIESEEHGHFFASSAVITNVTAQVKHMYSREPTFSYEMDSVVLSAMNNKHLSGTSGISAILNLNPTKIFINGKQFQDLLLFQEIWLPPEIRNAVPVAATTEPAPEKQEEYFAQKYQTVAAAAAFPWNATLHVTQLEVDVDLGQSIGKSSFTIRDLWASQQKSSSWEQSLCLGIKEIAVTSKGRMGGSVVLTGMAVRTSIQWPEENADTEARCDPLIQASIGFERLRAKTAFDYQAFAFGDIESFDFLMYNVRDPSRGTKDRLVAVLDCGKAYVFCISTGAAQAVALYQAFDRLVQEKQAAFEQSVRDIEKHLRRESVTTSKIPTLAVQSQSDHAPATSGTRKKPKKTVLSLHTDVVVTIKAISLGVFPSTFFDSQLLKLEANDIQARFAVGLEGSKITSRLGMTLGQLQVGLSTVKRANGVPKALEVSVDEVIHSAVSAKGGTIVRVPRVIASMQTWQLPDSGSVDYIFKSVFEGKIDVGWNLARINFIKSMWTTHTRALASRLGTPLPESAFKITAGPITEPGSLDTKKNDGPEAPVQEKITAEIKLPQSRYDYHALAPPVIETPQLRDMGEATPPLEWIGLQRERLPHVTHQIIIVTLLEVCREVEEAYERILGSS